MLEPGDAQLIHELLNGFLLMGGIGFVGFAFAAIFYGGHLFWKWLKH